MLLEDLHPDLIEACRYNSIDSSDIQEVLSFINGRNDYEDWHWICLIKNASSNLLSYAYITGGCDFTGWDCQSSAERFDEETLDEIMKLVPIDYKVELEAGLLNSLFCRQ